MMRKSGTFTGKHMALVFVGGFGIVIAVNLVMASFAVGSFHGTVVDNSYVASQKFNGYIEKAEQAGKLGWGVRGEQLADGRIGLATSGVPEGATIEAVAERPLGERETTMLSFDEESAGRWVSREPVDDGRWQMLVTISATSTAGEPQSMTELVLLP
jgi:nitrogen fixation protein FixH